MEQLAPDRLSADEHAILPLPTLKHVPQPATREIETMLLEDLKQEIHHALCVLWWCRKHNIVHVAPDEDLILQFLGVQSVECLRGLGEGPPPGRPTCRSAWWWPPGRSGNGVASMQDRVGFEEAALRDKFVF